MAFKINDSDHDYNSISIEKKKFLNMFHRVSYNVKLYPNKDRL